MKAGKVVHVVIFFSLFGAFVLSFTLLALLMRDGSSPFSEFEKTVIAVVGLYVTLYSYRGFRGWFLVRTSEGNAIVSLDGKKYQRHSSKEFLWREKLRKQEFKILSYAQQYLTIERGFCLNYGVITKWFRYTIQFTTFREVESVVSLLKNIRGTNWIGNSPKEHILWKIKEAKPLIKTILNTFENSEQDQFASFFNDEAEGEQYRFEEFVRKYTEKLFLDAELLLAKVEFTLD